MWYLYFSMQTIRNNWMITLQQQKHWKSLRVTSKSYHQYHCVRWIVPQKSQFKSTLNVTQGCDLRSPINVTFLGNRVIVDEVKEDSIAAAAKSLQSCPTLCDPIDGSPPGSPVPGVLQARTLEWVAISFSNAWKWKVKVKWLSRVRLLATP